MLSTKYDLKDVKEVVDLLLDQSINQIIRSNFINAFKYNTINGRLYGKYTTFGAKSFRLTSNSPNLLNIPSTGSIYAKPIKRCFQAEKGHIFCMVDYAALEDRVIANLSGDKNKCSIFLDGIDGHCLNSYYYFKEDIERILPRLNNEDLTSYIKRYKYEVDNGNKKLKAIRQMSKKVTFGLSYGAYPKKVSKELKSSIEYAEQIFNRYHNELYPDITKMREAILNKASEEGRIHLGLGCYLNTDDPERDIRTIANACCQFWSILSLLTINKISSLAKEAGLQNDIEIVSSIYDSIYFHVTEDVDVIKWLNDNLIPIMTKDFLKNTIVHNEAELECGYNWSDTVSIPNNASEEVIYEAMTKAKKLMDKTKD